MCPVVMYVSELFVDGKCIIDSQVGPDPGKILGVLGGDDIKNNNAEILVAPPSE